MIPLEHGIKIIIRDRERPGAGAAGLTTGSCTQKFHLSIYTTDAPALSPDRSRAGASAAPAGPIRSSPPHEPHARGSWPRMSRHKARPFLISEGPGRTPLQVPQWQQLRDRRRRERQPRGHSSRSRNVWRWHCGSTVLYNVAFSLGIALVGYAIFLRTGNKRVVEV